MTGLAASGPMLPRPSTAVPLVITPTRLAREVYIDAASLPLSKMAMQAAATPGGVGQRQVILVGQRLGRGDGDFAGGGIGVVVQRQLGESFVHEVLPLLLRERQLKKRSCGHSRPCRVFRNSGIFQQKAFNRAWLDIVAMQRSRAQPRQGGSLREAAVRFCRCVWRAVCQVLSRAASRSSACSTIHSALISKSRAVAGVCRCAQTRRSPGCGKGRAPSC